MISFKDFKKIKMKVGTITKVEEIPNSKNLVKLRVDIGGEVKQAVAGLKSHYKLSELEGKQFVFLTNLEPTKLMGELSEIMVLAAVEDHRVALVKPDKEMSNGAVVE